ncbi:hypothetical protein CANMA_002021 [Candida margitis]|uniref:uncharacterized protein n=1 Tax=Candida margitis TaxID=1775924 RepID=UPI002227C4BE|nr:uncharacterized protein CANMA_002021 [Candida margitis]KAI5968847.1 hypothetical protein CANMA_002021 [Candida margitis]
MTTQARSDKIYEDALIEFDSYTCPQLGIDGNITRSNHILTKLPNNTSSRMEFKSDQQKELTDLSDLSAKKPLDATSISDIHLKILQTKLALKAEREVEQRKLDKIKSHDRPLYYQLPSSGIKDFHNEIKDFLPPNVNLGESASVKNNIPRFYHSKLQSNKNMESKTNNYTIEEDENLDEYSSFSPTGEWENPIVKQALSRQVDLEFYTKSLLRNVLYLIVLLLFKSLLKKFIILYEINLKAQPLYKQMMYNTRFDFDTVVGSIYFAIAEQILTTWPVVNILVSTIKLLKGQDQCWDLPLSHNQRKLIGLNVDEVDKDDENEADLIFKQRQYNNDHNLVNGNIPKYSQVNDYTIYNGDSAKTQQNKYANNRWVYKS